MNTIGSISEKTETVSQNASVSRLKTIFDIDKSVHAVVVAEENKPVGLVMKTHLNDKLSQRYGFSLFIKKPIYTVMDNSPMIVNHDERIEGVSDKAMQRDNARLYDHIIILKHGVLHGIVAVRTILNYLVKFQREQSNILERYVSSLEQEDADKKKAIQDLKATKKMLQLVIDTRITPKDLLKKEFYPHEPCLQTHEMA